MRSSFINGLLLGLAITGFLSLWFFNRQVAWDDPSHWKEGESFVGTRSLEIADLPLQRVSEQLGFDDLAQAKQSARILATRIAKGFLLPDQKRNCDRKYPQPLCWAFNDYFSSRSSAGRSGGRRVRKSDFRTSKTAWLQKQDLGQLLSKTPRMNMKRIQAFANRALVADACPRNFSLSLGRALEDHLDEEGAWSLLDKLDDHGLECLESTERFSEYVHLRVALLGILRGQVNRPLGYLRKSYQAARRDESHRVAYWLLHLLDEDENADEIEKLREDLFLEHPLSWQAVLSYEEGGIDPLDIFSAVPAYPDEAYSHNPTIDKRTHWLRLMRELEDTSFVQNRYSLFIVGDLDREIRPGFFQHFARMMFRSGLYRSQIATINRLMNSHPGMVSIESLRLYFPLPYSDLVEGQTQNIDSLLVLALMRQESGFDPRAQSPANARGLMQILPSTARSLDRRVSANQLYDPSINSRLGIKYLEKLVRMFDNKPEYAFAAYNAGMGNMRKWQRRYDFAYKQNKQLFADLIPFRETREYVSSLLRNAYWYHRLFPDLSRRRRDKKYVSELLEERLKFHELPEVEGIEIPEEAIEKRDLPNRKSASDESEDESS